MSLRDIAAHLSAAGYPIQKDSVHRHVQSHVEISSDQDPGDLPARLALFLDAVAEVLEPWPTHAIRVARRLRQDGAGAEALRLLEQDVPESMRHRVDLEET